MSNEVKPKRNLLEVVNVVAKELLNKYANIIIKTPRELSGPISNLEHVINMYTGEITIYFKQGKEAEEIIKIISDEIENKFLVNVS